MKSEKLRPRRRERSGTFFAQKRADGGITYGGRLRLADGTKSHRLYAPEGFTKSETRKWLATYQAKEDIDGLMLQKKFDAQRADPKPNANDPEALTADQWHAKYLLTKDCGESHRQKSGHYWTKWISPIIGPKPMKDLTRDRIEDVRDKLDEAVLSGKIRSATARNIWGAFTVALKAAYAARDRSLRVHSQPLHFGILPPIRRESRQRPWLYPTEWTLFASCKQIPMLFRHTCALALYTGLRPGELQALTWADVDLTNRTISISKAIDHETGNVKPPKTSRGQRIIPIQPALLPLLETLKGEPGERVAKMLQSNEDRRAEHFRYYLTLAGCTRARLTADTDTEEPVDFRSLRDSHATWLALANVAEKVIQRRMGHANSDTTDKYIKAAESLDVEAIGIPFPALPPAIMVEEKLDQNPSWRATKRATKSKNPGSHRGFLVARVGFEPTTFGL